MQSIDISNRLASTACKHYPECGGCQLQHLPETEYRAHKTAQLIALFPDQPIEFIWGRAASRRRVEFKIDRLAIWVFMRLGVTMSSPLNIVLR
jgi:tRNA/tmRNA/rRNA uracil-C5-methylase (TrmA/RlmC/RlmD family)